MTATCQKLAFAFCSTILIAGLTACAGLENPNPAGGANTAESDGSIADASEGVPCQSDGDCLADEACEKAGKSGVCKKKPPRSCKPSPEVCNGMDDDCDGVADNGTPCSDGDACNGIEQCVDAQCVASKPLTCDDGNACTIDTCDPDTGCLHKGGKDGVSCDDGDACTGCSLGAGIQATYAAIATQNCPEAKYVGCNALWMPGFFDGNDKHVVRFDLEPGARFDWYGDGSAHLHGTAFPYHLGDGAGDKTAKYKVSIWFTYRGQGAAGEGTGGPKLDGGWTVPKAITDTWQYFDMQPGKATLQRVGSDEVVVLTQKPKGSVYPFQIGKGASNKTMALGSSAWFDYVRTGTGIATVSSHGDVNVDLSEEAVPVECDRCKDGKCSKGKPKTCDDGSACTTDSCDPKTGACNNVEITGACDDGTDCTVGDTCQAGKCKAGQPDDGKCEDGDPCTKDHCTVGQGCKFEAADPKTPCNDSNLCTSGDVCKGKKCVGGDEVDCDDGNPCTQDICYPKKGCDHKPIGGEACDDGDACTSGEACVAGSCVGGQAVTCDDDDVCTKDACDPKKGCTFAGLDGTGCSDGNACTSGDACVAGKCKPGDPLNCGDDNACTADSCDWKAGCLHKNLDGEPCSDDSACTDGDLCQGGKCNPGKAVTCDDGNACTQDSCLPTIGCAYEAKGGGACDDGDACSVGDTCVAGKCASGQAAQCDDGNPCTLDGCNKQTGCTHVDADGKACDDGSACSEGDVCDGGKCTAGKPVSCDDGNACTADACNPLTGCVSKPADGKACDDGTACTVGDACAGGQCVPGKTLVCNDGNLCTLDLCDAKLGCVTKDADGKPCDDGDKCTGGDACKGGKCQGKAPTSCDDGNPCTIDTCSATGGCAHKNADGYKCDDGNACTGGDACQGGKCAPGKAITCDDGNPCTSDVCDSAKGCTTKPADGVTCDDGNACTSGNLCKAGACAPGKATGCDDGNPCTTDGCDKVKGCSHTDHNGAACSDGNACTAGDACQSGKCWGGKAVSCKDGNDCTADLCLPAKGCVFEPNDGLACDDGSACTTGDVCQGGKCAGKTPASCDDGNPCTKDGCDPKGGCSHVFADGAACEDGSVCTAGDQCGGGKCLPGKAKGCDDGNPCTADECDPVSGCTHEGLSSGKGSVEIVSDEATLAGGAKAVPTWDQHTSWTANIPGATWIWSSYTVSDPVGETTVVFERTFSLPAGASKFAGSLVVAADNSYTCLLNGQAVAQDATEFNYFESGKDTWPIGAQAKPGVNVLQCTVKNWKQWYGTPYSNPAGLLYKLSLAFDTVTTCDDGNACTQGDACVVGKCVGGPAKTCDDGNTCSADACDPKTGACTSVPADGGTCNDGNACTGACLPAGVSKAWIPSTAYSDTKVAWAIGGHSLHIPGFFDGNGGHTVRMHFDGDARFEMNVNGTAKMYGHATVFTTGGAAGSVGEKWYVDVALKFRGTGTAGQGSGGPKKELKDGYQPKSLTDTWMYFDILPGQAKITKAGAPQHWAALTQAPKNSMYPFQIGVGANGKNLNLGASSWFYYTRYAPGGSWSGQGDFNLDFTPFQPAGTCDTCTQGQCGGKPVSCDDGNPCTADSCSPKLGCLHTNVPGCCGK